MNDYPISDPSCIRKSSLQQVATRLLGMTQAADAPPAPQLGDRPVGAAGDLLEAGISLPCFAGGGPSKSHLCRPGSPSL